MKKLLTAVLQWMHSSRLPAIFEDGIPIYERGDYVAAFGLWRTLADRGDARAQAAVSDMYRSGQGVDQNAAEALKWLRLAAEQGHADSQFGLALMYRNGKGIPKDYSEATKWMQLAAGHWSRRLARAVELYRLADEGDPDAQTQLGLMYKKGENVERDYIEALEWFRLAAGQGYAKGQKELGHMYDGGHGVRRDEAEALKWYQLAAEQSGIALDQYLVGVMYYDHRSLHCDMAEAAKWIRKAADQGYAEAQEQMAYMYEQGEGVSKDHSEAMKMYRLAAEQGNGEAARCLRRAAKRGNIHAQLNLGLMCSGGKSVPTDKIEAYKWLSIASAIATDDGFRAEANRVRNIVASMMTSEEITEAQKCTREWKPR